MKAIRIDVNGNVQPLGGFSLDTLQKSVGGYVQAVESASGETTFWCNEEGKLEGLPVNKAATFILWSLNTAFRDQDFLVGSVVITGGVDDDGNTLPIGEEALMFVKGLMRSEG